MNSDAEKSTASEGTTGASWFVVGSVLSVVSAIVLAWKGTICVDVLRILLARDISELFELGPRLGRVSWCPLGVAVGTTLIAAGFRRTAVRGRLSRRALGLVALYGVFAACGAFFVFQGTSGARDSMFVIATSERPIKPEEVHATISQSVEEAELETERRIKPEEVHAAISQAATMVSRGWILLVVGQVILAIAGLVQFANQAKSSVDSLRWHKLASMALSLLWIFGAFASINLFRRSWELLELRGENAIKASVVVEMLNGVVTTSWFASLFLLGHAALTTVVAAAVYRRLSQGETR